MINKKVDMLKDVADSNETLSTSEQVTIGSLLKSARKKQGASVGDIAGELHLRPCIVENIEADNFADIASAIYVKGYVKNYARIVQADLEKIKACLDIQLPKACAPEMQSFSRKTTRQARDGRLMFVTYLIALILLALLILWWVQKSDTQASVDFSQPTMEEIADSASESFSTRALPDPNEERDSGIEDTDRITEPANVAATSEPVVPEKNVKPATQQQAVISEQQYSLLSLSLAADCWINVKDANGNVLINDLKKAGSQLEVEGREPFNLTLGAPQVVTIKLNNESISLADYPTGRVARLTLPF
ncbi:DUF4115 domain-containing protein [Shewanella sp. VB17]|uniref:RodZ domain-containing protein n=1 Tax=Shewanella sp. VB17 TaxID=2739432 RepID=UPI0015672552|nr:RodZ domain-containing protein [Shewanella sp. VB17]NRD73292.1 DUF4115 domain-containing protein [Shewanella sp. VB17]